MKNFTTLLAVAAFATISAPAAWAATPSEARTESVRYGDLDTTNAEGAATLYRRISGAAKRVCGDPVPSHSLGQRQRRAGCVYTAISNAIASVDRPAVTTYAASRGVFTGENTPKIARQ